MIEEPPRNQTQGILVADDDEEVRELLRDILEERDYRVFEAKDGKDTIRQLGQRQIDLVILDLVMPEQEGIETIRFLRRGCPDIKVLAISGAFGGGLLQCAQALGAHGVLKKPFSCDSVISQVERLLGSTGF